MVMCVYHSDYGCQDLRNSGIYFSSGTYEIRHLDYADEEGLLSQKRTIKIKWRYDTEHAIKQNHTILTPVRALENETIYKN